MTIFISKGIIGLKQKAPLYSVLVSNQRAVFYGSGKSCEEIDFKNLRYYEKLNMRDVIYDEFARLLLNKNQATYNYNKILDSFTYKESQEIKGELKYYKNSSQMPLLSDIAYLGCESPNGDLLILGIDVSTLNEDYKDSNSQTVILELYCKSGLNRVTYEFKDSRELKILLGRILNRVENIDRYVKYIPLKKLLNGLTYDKDYRMRIEGHANNNVLYNKIV